MKKNLKNKVLLIIAVLVVFTYGIIGVPSGVSGKALMEALSNRIHLGLDLRGGAHLILQVVVSEAVASETDNTVARGSAGLEDGQADVLAGVQARSDQASGDPPGRHDTAQRERGALPA